MEVSSCSCPPRVFNAYSSFQCHFIPNFSGAPIGNKALLEQSRQVTTSSFCTRGGVNGVGGVGGISSLIFPNFVCQLSNKACCICSNICVKQVVRASWSNDPALGSPSSSATKAASAATVRVDDDEGERLDRLGIVSDAIATPVFNTTVHYFKNTRELIEYKEKRHEGLEYGRYGNYTTVVAEEKISALEGAASTLITASGMCATTVMLMALVPAGGHIVTTTHCYRKARTFIDTILLKMGISAAVIDLVDFNNGLEAALNMNKVSLFFTESPTNLFLRCVDIELVSKLCHSKGALVCIDATLATPFNQKVLSLGADLVLHSATKFIGGHNDVLAGCISGSEDLVNRIRTLHHTLGGILNPNAAYLIIRGMKTLHLRVQQQNSTALKMAQVLELHPKVKRVYYPGLPSHPEHEIAKKQMTGLGGVVYFEIPYIAPSFGGCESIVVQPAIMSYWDLSHTERLKYGIGDNLVRFSFGVEDFKDCKADVLQALNTI